MILEALAASKEPMTPATLGKALGLPKPTIHRLVTTLLEEGFLAKDQATKGVRPGRRARSMANGLIHNSTDAVIRRQILNQIASDVQETVNFASPTENGMIYVDRVETDWAFRIQLPIGATVPFHRTASGKTYLASLPKPKRLKLVETLDFSEGTANSHKSIGSLLTELREISLNGYAIDNEELLEGMVALAVPVYSQANDFVAAVAFHGPCQRLSIAKLKGHLEAMKATSERLSKLLF